MHSFLAKCYTSRLVVKHARMGLAFLAWCTFWLLHLEYAACSALYNTMPVLCIHRIPFQGTDSVSNLHGAILCITEPCIHLAPLSRNNVNEYMFTAHYLSFVAATAINTLNRVWRRKTELRRWYLQADKTIAGETQIPIYPWVVRDWDIYISQAPTQPPGSIDTGDTRSNVIVATLESTSPSAHPFQPAVPVQLSAADRQAMQVEVAPRLVTLNWGIAEKWSDDWVIIFIWKLQKPQFRALAVKHAEPKMVIFLK